MTWEELETYIVSLTNKQTNLNYAQLRLLNASQVISINTKKLKNICFYPRVLNVFSDLVVKQESVWELETEYGH